MRNGRLCPISGGSTIGGKSGDRVCVRSTSSKLGAAVSACSQPCKGSLGGRAIFVSVFFLILFCAALFVRLARLFLSRLFPAALIGCPRSARAQAPWHFRDAAPASLARLRPDRRPPSSLARRQPARRPARSVKVLAAIPVGPTRRRSGPGTG